MKRPNGFWNIDKCKVDALKFNTRNEWRIKSCAAYSFAFKNNILNECCSHMLKLGSKYKRLIYGFEFPDKSVYIGLTCNSKERINLHLTDSRSQVFRYVKKTGTKPLFKELTEYFDVNLASLKEGEFLEKYRANGWNVLNKNKTGGLGGGIRKWTKEKCIEDASKYKTKIEWKKNSESAYNASLKNKWHKESCNHMTQLVNLRGFWKFENCLNDAKRYKTITQWRKFSNRGYYAAHRNDWLNECTIHMKQGK